MLLGHASRHDAWCWTREGAPRWCDRLVPAVDAGITLVVAGTTLPIGTAGLYGMALLPLFAVAGEYSPHRSLSVATRLPRLVALTSLASVAVASIAVEDHVHLRAVVRCAPATVVALAVGRAATYALLRRHRPRHRPDPTLIVGSGVVATRLIERLRNQPSHGLEPIGVVDDVRCRETDVPLLGSTRDLVDVIERHDVRRVIVAFGHLREDELVHVIRRCERHDVEIYVVPRLFELGAASSSDHLEGIPIIRLSRATLRPGSWRLKRAFDLVVGSVGTVLVAPVMAVIAALVKATSPGPVLFRQVRIGQRGRPIEVLKFRTMAHCSDSDTCWTVDGDPRVTRLGAFLRRTSLDELPQLFNVLRGDMSLVGPRPERPHFAEQFRTTVPRYDDRLRVPVGMTGLAQVHGLRGDTSISERVWFDNRYIEHWSLWSDVVILVRTIAAVLRRAPSTDAAVDGGTDTVEGAGTVLELARAPSATGRAADEDAVVSSG